MNMINALNFIQMHVHHMFIVAWCVYYILVLSNEFVFDIFSLKHYWKVILKLMMIL